MTTGSFPGPEVSLCNSQSLFHPNSPPVYKQKELLPLSCAHQPVAPRPVAITP